MDKNTIYAIDCIYYLRRAIIDMIREIMATARVYLAAVSVFPAMFNIALARFLSNSRSIILRNVSEWLYSPSEYSSVSSKGRLRRKKFFIVEYLFNKYKYRRSIKKYHNINTTPGYTIIRFGRQSFRWRKETPITRYATGGGT